MGQTNSTGERRFIGAVSTTGRAMIIGAPRRQGNTDPTGSTRELEYIFPIGGTGWTESVEHSSFTGLIGQHDAVGALEAGQKAATGIFRMYFAILVIIKIIIFNFCEFR